MIHLFGRAIFIHIPRTSGISLAKALMSHADIESLSADIVLGRDLGPFKRHSTAHELHKLLPEWDQLTKFTIIRNPWRICESNYRYFQRIRERIENAEGFRQSDFRKRLATECDLPFGKFVVKHHQFLHKGFFAHWALKGGNYQDLGVKAYLFEELEQQWPEICEILELPKDTVRPRENAGLPMVLEWTDEAVGFVRKRCELDFELFGYPLSP